MSKRQRPARASKRAKEPEATGADNFRMELRISINAAVGTCFVRTSEPFEAMQAIEDMCVLDRLPLRQWNVIRGWQTVDTKDEKLRVTEADPETADPLPALNKLYDALTPMPGTQVNAQTQAAFPQDCICVMMWPDAYIKGLPQMRAMIAEVARELQTFSQRLVMIVPPSFTVPDEIAEMIPIIDFGLPTQTEMLDIYKSTRADATDAQREMTREFNTADELSVCKAGAGMTRGEFSTALAKAYVSLEMRKERGIDRFRQIVMDTKIEVVKRSEVLEVLAPVPLSQVGGLANLKDWVLKRRRAFTEEAREAGVDAPKGIAAVGPPGTGKSLLAKATGAALQFPVIRFDISRVFGSLVGESEARMAKALAMIDAMAPCVAMVDEVDKVFSMGGGNDSGTSTRVLGKILTHMQETKHPIFWVLTMNRVDNLPPELLRKGRVSEIWSVSTPTEKERMEILCIHLKLRGEDPDYIDNLDGVIDACAGFVGGEIEAAVIDAKTEAFNNEEDLTAQHLIDAFRVMKPLSITFKADFDRMAAWAEQHARPASDEIAKAQAAGTSRTRSRGRNIAGSRDDMAG